MARIPFLVVTSLAVDCILGTTFLGCHVKAILQLNRKVVLHEAPPVALVGTTSSRQNRTMASRKTAQQLPSSDKPERRQVEFPFNTPSGNIRLVRGVTIPPMVQALVRAATPVGGYVFTELPKNRAQEIPPHGTGGHGWLLRNPVLGSAQKFWAPLFSHPEAHGSRAGPTVAHSHPDHCRVDR